MNRKNLIGLMVAVAATAALCGRASAATPQISGDTGQEAARALDVARNAWTECVRAAIPKLDHPESTSEAVARAAMNGCSDRYADMVRALLAHLGASLRSGLGLHPQRPGESRARGHADCDR